MNTNNVLLARHLEMLQKSSISEEVIAARGYRSAQTQKELREIGFSEAQSNQVPGLLIPIWGVEGQVVIYQFRPDNPRIIKGKPIKYETLKGAKMALDVPPTAKEWMENISRPLIITEGSKKADAAVSRGLCCISLLGVWNWRGRNESGGSTALADWENIALKGRKVYICFDSDVVTKPNVNTALQRLKAFLEGRGAESVKVTYLPPGLDGAKVGLDDFLAAGHSTDELFDLASPELQSLPTAQEPRAPSAAQILIKIGSQATLFRSEREEAFACFPTNGHSETWPVRSKSFRKWLSFQFYTEFDKPPNTQAMEEAMQVLEAKCDFQGEKRSLSLRMAQSDGALWLDLADDQWQAVRITPDGWKVVQQPPLLFRRYAPASAQIVPNANGSLTGLRQFVNVKDESLYCQLVVWLVSTFFPEIAHPVLVVYGEQGSAKSTLMRLLALLVDPSKVPLRAEPRDIGEWVQAADHSYMVTLDNVSNLRAWLSDALCRAVTGEGFAKRQLYSDGDDVIISFRRVVAMTGIEVVPERADLFDRALLMELEPIEPEQRRLESEVLADFDRLRPELLGGLLDLVAGVLRELPSVRLDWLPRMADFARIGVAVERVLQWPEGTFIDAYSGNIASQHEEALAISAIGEPLQLFMKKHIEWSGTAKELLDALGTFAGETSQRAREWPKSARAIGGLLRRMAPNLRAVGINVNFATPHGKRLIHLNRTVRASTVPMVPFLTKSPPMGTQMAAGGTQTAAGGTQMELITRDRNARNIVSESLSGSDCFGLTDGDAPAEGNYAQSVASRNPRLANERVPGSLNVSSEQQEILATKKEDYDPSRGGLAPPGSMETSNQSLWNNDEREDTLI